MRRLLAAAALALGLCAPAAAQPVPTGWHQFRGHATHSSSQTVAGSVVQHPRLKWGVALPLNGFSSGIGETAFGSDNTSSGENGSRLRASVSIGTNGRLFAAYGRVMTALNANDGSTLWTATSPVANMPNNDGFGFTQPIVLSTTIGGTPTEIVVTSSYAAIVAFRASDGAVMWTANPNATFSGRAPGSVGPTGVVYFGGTSERGGTPETSVNVYARNSSDGSALWTYNTAAITGPVGLSPEGATAYFLSNGYMHAVDAYAGVLIASVSVNGVFSYALTVAEDGAVYSFSRIDSNSYRAIKFAAGLAGGTTVWQSAKVWGSCCIAAVAPRSGAALLGGNLFLNDTGSLSSQLTSFGTAGGADNWNLSRLDSGMFPYTSFSPAASTFQPLDSPFSMAGGGYGYITDGVGGLTSIDPALGTVRWRYQYRNHAGSPNQTMSSSFGPQGGQVAISTSGALYLFTATSNFGTRSVFAFEESGAASLTLSTATPSVSGTGLWTTTITATVLDGVSAAVSGAPVEIRSVVQTAPATAGTAYGVTPSSRASGNDYFDYSNTSAVGVSTFLVTLDLGLLGQSYWDDFSGTVTVRTLGLPDQTVLLREIRASTFTVQLSTPSIEDNGADIVRVTTVTFTVSNSTGGRVPGFPVALTPGAYTTAGPGACGVPSSVSANYAITDSTGQARITYRLKLWDGSGPPHNPCVPAADMQNLSLPLTARALGLTSVAVDAKETRASTFTVTFSETAIKPSIRAATMTVTVYDAMGATVPYTPVVYHSPYVLPGATRKFAFGNRDSGATLCNNDTVSVGYTDAFGQARFVIWQPSHFSCLSANKFDNYTDIVTTNPVASFNLPPSTPTLLLQDNFLDSYQVVADTVTSVGIAFRSTVTALNVHGERLLRYDESGVTLTPLFDGTAVQGTGSLGTSVISFASSLGQVVISSQTYNKIENIQIKATRGSGNVKTGTSNTVVINGPSHFQVIMPTATQAGVAFSMTIRAVDASSTPVVGYAGTVSLSALNAGNPSQAGAGTLGVTNVNVPANGTITIANQTYTKAEGIVIRAADTGASIVGQSSYTTTVGAGAPASVTILANPQSTIAGVPSVLTATIQDAFNNPVSNSTATFAVQSGSGVVSLSLVSGAVVSAVTSTQAVTDASGQASAFFSSTNTLSAQANLLRASIGALTKDTTVYSAVLITAAGGAVANFGDPRLRVDCPANTWGFSIRMGVESRDEIPAATLAVATAAFASQPNTFVSTTVMRVTAVRDSSPTTAAGAGSKLTTVSLPYTVASGSVTVGSYRGQSVLVPLSVLRVFKLNNATSSFEMVLDGTNAINTASGTVTAEVSDPDGVYAIGAPAFATLSSTQTTTVTASIGAGTTAQVLVPAGAFPAGTTLSVGVPSESAIPGLPTALRLQAIGTAISVTAGGSQPSAPVTIRLGYTAAAVAGVSTDRLRLARYDATTGWQILDSAADAGNRTVVGTTDHFSLFMIVAVSPGSSIAQGFVFPNPFRPSQGHTRIKLAGLPPGAKVRVFSAAGRLLKELESDAVGQILNWDGTDRDGRALASGVYLAVIDGEGGRRTIKFAVQR